jgi:hypothetical protein
MVLDGWRYGRSIKIEYYHVGMQIEHTLYFAIQEQLLNAA